MNFETAMSLFTIAIEFWSALSDFEMLKIEKRRDEAEEKARIESEKQETERIIQYKRGALLSLTVVIGYILFKKVCSSRTAEAINEETTDARLDQTADGYVIYNVYHIISATNGFSRENIIGGGAHSTVYKGILPSAQSVAIRRFNRIGIFNNRPKEFPKLLRHDNLVQLLGFCCEAGDIVLVYEFNQEKRLDRFLHGNLGADTVLSWGSRFNIILGVASALTYLHDNMIIHGDLNTSNVMLELDNGWNAKLGDFGLTESNEHTTNNMQDPLFLQTMGYLAPEYINNAIPTDKTDVFSFGMLILEVATGKRPPELMLEENLLKNVAEAVRNELQLELELEHVQLERVLEVGLRCTAQEAGNRPSMMEATRLLRECN